MSQVVLFAIFGLIQCGRLSAQLDSERESNESIAAALLTKLEKQDPRVRPGIYGPPTKVLIDFYVQSFGPLDEVEMEFNVDLDFRETWEDPRLRFNTTNPDQPVYIPPTQIDKFGIPDVYFPNEKAGKSHDITIPNRSIRIYGNGTVRYFSRMAMTISCTMYLATFPLDKQHCYIKISTYSYDEHEIELKWKDNEHECDSIEIKKSELNLPQFVLKRVKQHDPCKSKETYKTGEFSCLQASFYLERLVGFFVLQTYIPSILIVMLSWVAFWINKNSEPARIALGVTTVLTMTTQLTSSRSNTMRVSYPKAMDVWYSFCMVFVFAALIEYAFVNVSVRMEKKREDRSHRDGHTLLSGGESDVEKQGEEDTERVHADDNECFKQRFWKRLIQQWQTSVTSKDIDHVSRRVFPATYLVFNIIYWAVYANIRQNTGENDPNDYEDMNNSIENAAACGE